MNYYIHNILFYLKFEIKDTININSRNFNEDWENNCQLQGHEIGEYISELELAHMVGQPQHNYKFLF
jgi:hypothetical protein